MKRGRSPLLILAVLNMLAAVGIPVAFKIAIGIVDTTTYSSFHELEVNDVFNSANLKKVSNGRYGNDPKLWIEEMLAKWRDVSHLSNFVAVLFGTNSVLCFYLWWPVGEDGRQSSPPPSLLL